MIVGRARPSSTRMIDVVVGRAESWMIQKHPSMLMLILVISGRSILSQKRPFHYGISTQKLRACREAVLLCKFAIIHKSCQSAKSVRSAGPSMRATCLHPLSTSIRLQSSWRLLCKHRSCSCWSTVPSAARKQCTSNAALCGAPLLKTATWHWRSPWTRPTVNIRFVRLTSLCTVIPCQP